MKFRSFSFAALSAVVTLSLPVPLLRAAEPVADAPAAAPASVADQDWEAFRTGSMPKQPRPPAGSPEAEVFCWAFGGMLKTITELGMDFYAKHPEDPRRWEAVSRMENIFMSWQNGLSSRSPEVIAEVDKVMSAEERASWVRKFTELEAALRVSGDVPGAVSLYFDAKVLMGKIKDAANAKLPADAPEWAAAHADLEGLLARYPQEEGVQSYAGTYLRIRFPEGADQTLQQAELKWLAGSANEAVAKYAKGELDRAELLARPMEMAFAAADGRVVDLKAMRGKVVLIDFWATWCGPCIAELPNVKKVFAEYHDKGFEIVGISLENGKLLPKDTPEQTATKLEAAKKILTDFTVKENMPWPQYFDGKWWKNDISTKYAIQGIPAMFLLDQDGKVVSTNARGELLEKEVKRLLKL